MASTRMSSKGQVIIPKSVRQSKLWAPGTNLIVEETEEGVLLKAEPRKKKYTIDDLYGVVKYDGPPRTIEEMGEAVAEGAVERYERSQK